MLPRTVRQILELYTAITNNVPIVSLFIHNAFEYDYGKAVEYLEHLDSYLEAAYPGALQMLKENGADPEDVAYKLANTLPNVISTPFNPKASSNLINAELLDLVSVMGRATALPIRISKEKWLANRAAKHGATPATEGKAKWPWLPCLVMRVVLLLYTSAPVIIAIVTAVKTDGKDSLFPLLMSSSVCAFIQMFLEFPKRLAADRQRGISRLARDSSSWRITQDFSGNEFFVGGSLMPKDRSMAKHLSKALKRVSRHVNGWIFAHFVITTIGLSFWLLYPSKEDGRRMFYTDRRSMFGALLTLNVLHIFVVAPQVKETMWVLNFDTKSFQELTLFAFVELLKN